MEKQYAVFWIYKEEINYQTLYTLGSLMGEFDTEELAEQYINDFEKEFRNASRLTIIPIYSKPF